MDFYKIAKIIQILILIMSQKKNELNYLYKFGT